MVKIVTPSYKMPCPPKHCLGTWLMPTALFSYMFQRFPRLCKDNFMRYIQDQSTMIEDLQGLHQNIDLNPF
jgi:hypothetical protein